MDFDSERIVSNPWVVGAVGAFIAAFRFVPGAGWKEQLFNGVCGTLIAGFLTPALVEWLHMTSPAFVGGAAFVGGLVGMSLIAAVLQGIKDTPFGQIITGWLSRRS